MDGGINLFAYVQNNPVNFIDPWGLRPPDFPYSSFPGKKVSKTNPFVQITQKNIAIAESIYNPWTFKELVENRGAWDYKQYFSSWQDFGNYHYGVMGAASGLFTLETLLREAGRAQCRDKTNDPSFGNPNTGPPYGDDPRDQKWIKEGWNDYMSGMYGAPKKPGPIYGVPMQYWGGEVLKRRK